MKLWRYALRVYFCGTHGLHPHHLGMEFLILPRAQELLVNRGNFCLISNQYHPCYTQLLGNIILHENQSQETIQL